MKTLALGLVPLAALALPTAALADAPTGTRIGSPDEVIIVIGAIRDPNAPAPVIDESADSDLPELPVEFDEAAPGD